MVCVFFSSKLSLSASQTVWIQIRTDILPVLILVQTVCKGYQQTTKVAASKERVKNLRMEDSRETNTDESAYLLIVLNSLNNVYSTNNNHIFNKFLKCISIKPYL